MVASPLPAREAIAARPAPRAAVAVVHWGHGGDVMRCLRAVAGSTFPAQPLIVVDNGTGTLSMADVTAAAPGAVLITLPENIGFSGGSNIAIERALAEGADYVLLLNNDATLEPDCLGELVRVASSMPRVGAVGAKVLSATDSATIWAAYGRLTYRAALVKLVGQGEADSQRFNEVCEVDCVPGCSMLLSRAAIAEIGLLDDRFFAYHEDVDWCTSVRQRGWRVLFAPAARVIHLGEASLSNGNGSANPARYLSARNTMLFARKHAGAREWLRLGITIGGSLAREYVRGRRRGDTRIVTLLARGYVDGLLGREVPYRSFGLR